ncbi:hypothetical protein LF1_47300 [Rubripirellula obstinata]|uniref:Uncharacterized protein n=2 Tax=Rubripirellula obstinata TaxID=406547 RepID=A0A5B1CM75_9BACT|nr:hypothetical protein LF1_47300 [Rubripirellula obstinata]
MPNCFGQSPPLPSAIHPDATEPYSVFDSNAVAPPIDFRPQQIDQMAEIPIQRFRKSFYQGAEVLGGHLFDTGSKLGGLDMTFEEARVSFGVPLGSLENILGLRPYFRATHLNGPSISISGNDLDVPETLYETGVTFLNQKTWTEKISTTIIVSPAVRSDLTTSEGAIRIFGLGLLNYQCSDVWKVSVGAVYLDREDVSLLPAIGFTWTPSPDLKFDGMIPRPRLSKRLWKQGGEAEGWVYLGAGFGGNSWAVSRDNGRKDQLTIRDYRLMAGYEVIRAGNRGLFIETGYAFGRSLEYVSEDLERDLDDGVFIQASWRF